MKTLTIILLFVSSVCFSQEYGYHVVMRKNYTEWEILKTPNSCQADSMYLSIFGKNVNLKKILFEKLEKGEHPFIEIGNNKSYFYCELKRINEKYRYKKIKFNSKKDKR